MIKRVLLIDDDHDDAEIFEEALADCDNTAIFKYIDDGREALRELQQQRIQIPHIIFLDVNMPIISGWDCLTALKSNNILKQVPVIMYSTSSHEREIGKAAELGAAMFITKPHNYNELKNKITDVMNIFIAK